MPAGAARGGGVPPPHVEPQREVERVDVDDEVRDAVDEHREGGGLDIRGGERDPAGEQDADAERRREADEAARGHGAAAPAARARLRLRGAPERPGRPEWPGAGNRRASSASMSCSSAMCSPRAASTGAAARIQTSERTREGRWVPLRSAGRVAWSFGRASSV